MRYAVYLAPKEGSDLANAGASWLGRDALSGSWEMMPEIPGIGADRMVELTRSPRRYGFHATLKAPFRLHECATERDLLSAIDLFARREPPVPLAAGLKVGELGGFLALVQGGPDIGLNAFAARAVEHFESMRAALRVDELAKRRQARLTPHQDALMVKWGYPYVFDQFTFHMTLTERIAEGSERAAVRAAAEAHFSPALDDLTSLRHIALFKESESDGSFRIVQHFELTGPATGANVRPHIPSRPHGSSAS